MMVNRLYAPQAPAKTPRDYQDAAFPAVMDWFENKEGWPLVVIPTGGGKSLIMAEFIRRALEIEPSTRFMIVSHVSELLKQNAEALLGQCPSIHLSFYSDKLGQKDLSGQVIIAGIQSVFKKAHQIQSPPPDIILIDECFTGETLIETPNGKKRIDSLKKGDVVLNACGQGTISAIRCSLPTHLIKMELSNGRSIKCTPNHPFFTRNGWKKAGELERGEGLFTAKELRAMQESLYAMDKKSRRWARYLCMPRRDMDEARMLLNILREEMEKPDEQKFGSYQAKRNATENKVLANKTRGEWLLVADSAISIASCARRWMASRMAYKNLCRASQWGISKLLQGGYSKRGFEDCNRNRWWQPLFRRKENPRQQEGCPLGKVRVESISCVERESFEPVFNLCVSGHPSYFANGVLVHNCHLIPHSSEGMYRRFLSDILQINPAMKVVGMTATPFRAKTGLLHKGEGAMFGGIAYEIGILDLIERGYLCHITTPSMATRMSTEGVKVQGGDYVQKHLEAAVDKDEITTACVDEIMQNAEGRRKWLIFTAGVNHCLHVRDEIRSRGIACEMVTGDTETGERNRIIAWHKEQCHEPRCLVNVSVLTTGYDNPAIDLIAFMRPTRSPVLYIQMIGRAMRICKGKDDAVVLDFGGVIETLGPIDQIRLPTRKKGEGEAPHKTCPECGEENHAAARLCIQCGFEFPAPEIKIGKGASEAAVLSTQVRTETYPVTSVSYRRHKKEGKPDTFCVEYASGMTKSFRSWWCIEHGSSAREMAAFRWRQASGGKRVPNTVGEALERTAELRKPVSVTTKKNGKYHEVVGVEYE